MEAGNLPQGIKPKKKYANNWLGYCIKCDEPMKSAHHSGICPKCRTVSCAKCKKPFKPSAKSSSMCSNCRGKMRTEEYRYNMDEEHYL